MVVLRIVFLVSVLFAVGLAASSESYCYKYFYSYPEKLHWLEAVSKCRSYGLNWELVSIKTEHKATEIDEYLNSINAGNVNNARIWTSGHRRDETVQQKYLWLDGLSPVESSDGRWAENPLVNGEYNIVLKRNQTKHWAWHIQHDDSGFNYYLCEKKSC